MHKTATELHFVDTPPDDDERLPRPDDDGADTPLRAAHRTAFVGASSLPWRASHSVMR